jgi:transcriptional regulator with XRE-family HTH domain
MPKAEAPRELGPFLRAHRERMAPTSTGGRRRTPGLRREELAHACGVSVTWITWLEQGRDVSASPGVLARLAEALHLSAAERASLFDLAGKRDPSGPAEPPSDLPSSVLELPSLLAVPAYLLDHAWTARAWNRAAAQLFAGWLDDDGAERNLLRFTFLSPAARTLIAGWQERARRLVAEFRADYSRRPRDPAFQALVSDLSEASPAFRALWQKQEVLRREGGERAFQHPVYGRTQFRQTTLVVASHPECKLVCLVPESKKRGARPKHDRKGRR